MAEGVFASLVDQAGLAEQIEIDSAGTSGWHEGDPADERAREAAEKRGFSESHVWTFRWIIGAK